MLNWLTRLQIHAKRLVDSWNDLCESIQNPNDVRFVAWFQGLGQARQQAFQNQR